MKAAVMTVCSIFVLGCGGSGDSSTALSARPDAADRAEPVPSQRAVLSMARQSAIDQDDGIVRLAEMAGSDADERDYRMFEMTEPEFVRAVTGASREEHLAVAEPIDRELKEIRPFLNTAVRAAVERARSGDVETAVRALDALERIAEISAREGQLEIGRMVAIRLKEQVAQARAEIAKLER